MVELRQSYPFLRFVLTNAETNLASAERPLMEKYATLCPSEDNKSAERLLADLLVCINAIASGLRTTG